MELTTKIPTRWVVSREKAQYDAQIRQLQRGAQKAWEHLRGMPDLPELPAWDKLTTEWIDEAVQAKHDQIDDLDYVTQEERTRLKQQWNLRRNLVAHDIKEIG